MSWKIFLSFVAGLSTVPVGVVTLLTIDDIISRRATKKWWDENRWDGSCPLPACRDLSGNRRPMCNHEGRPPCDVLLAIREGVYEQVYGDE